MQSFVNLTNDWCSTCQYGLGLFKEDQYEISARSKPEQLYMVGHAGTNWASNAELSSYNPHFDFGIALATNSATGLDCKRTIGRPKHREKLRRRPPLPISDIALEERIDFGCGDQLLRRVDADH
eukprot:COSAG04_NODE_6261_length_1370_cov_0.870968_1_plen_123_part_10